MDKNIRNANCKVRMYLICNLAHDRLCDIERKYPAVLTDKNHEWYEKHTIARQLVNELYVPILLELRQKDFNLECDCGCGDSLFTQEEKIEVHEPGFTEKR